MFFRIRRLIIYWIYWRQKMNNRPISPITNEPFKVENYYFQVLIQKLIPKKQPATNQSIYLFTTVKDYQKFQTSKPVVINPGSEEYPLQGIKINFVAVSYNPTKPLAYDLRMIQSFSDRNKQIGEYIIDANSIIQQFMESQNGAFAFRVDFNDDWAADIELYVDTSRYGVQRLVHQIKNPKPKRADDISIPLEHQKIIAKRKAMDQEAKKEEEKFTHHKNFVKFSPKRDRREESEEKKKEQSKQKQKKIQKSPIAASEQKKSPKGAFVPKKQWMIPEAQKYIAKTKNSSKSASLRGSQAKQQKLSEKQVKSLSRTRTKPIQQPSFMDKFPVQPKYLLLAAIIFIVLFVASSFLTPNNTPTPIPVETPNKVGKKNKESVKESQSKKGKVAKTKK